ncbi:MAG: type II toxin-antitoxin system HicA family toxin [Planctomycetes bacterium]|nr:type II toxin-antitoxin system HicA family toxin [Planctomycetota bacterium]
MTVYELIRRLLDDGWFLLVQRGSHRQFAHPWKPGRVTGAGHRRERLCPETERSALRQAGLVPPRSDPPRSGPSEPRSEPRSEPPTEPPRGEAR